MWVKFSFTVNELKKIFILIYFLSEDLQVSLITYLSFYVLNIKIIDTFQIIIF